MIQETVGLRIEMVKGDKVGVNRALLSYKMEPGSGKFCVNRELLATTQSVFLKHGSQYVLQDYNWELFHSDQWVNGASRLEEG